MERTRASLIAALAVVGFALSVLIERLWKARAWAPVSLPLVTALALGIWALALGILGWQVRRLTKREDTWLSREGALQVVLAALASSRGGALFAGGFAGRAVTFMSFGSTQWLASEIVSAWISLAAAAVLVAVSLLVEHWGALPPDDHDKGETSPAY